MYFFSLQKHYWRLYERGWFIKKILWNDHSNNFLDYSFEMCEFTMPEIVRLLTVVQSGYHISAKLKANLEGSEQAQAQVGIFREVNMFLLGLWACAEFHTFSCIPIEF